jgi:hypothetical protein
MIMKELPLVCVARNRPFLRRSPNASGSAPGRPSLAALMLAVSMALLMPFPASATPRVTGDKLWAARYARPTSGVATSVATDGSRVYVTGSILVSSGLDYATVAYHAATGHKLWSRRYIGPGNSNDLAESVATDGTGVYVTGSSSGSSGDPLYATVAYEAG